MTEMERQAEGSASSTRENSLQPDNRFNSSFGEQDHTTPRTAGSTTTLEPSSPKPKNDPPSTPRTTASTAQPQSAGSANRLELCLQLHDASVVPSLPQSAIPESPTGVAVPCTVDDQGTPSSNLVTGRLTSRLPLLQMEMRRDNNNQPR